MRTLRSERGETSLVGLLVAMVIFTIVLGATLTAFETLTTRNNEEAQRADVEDRAHVAVERLTRELRNVAQPQSDGAPTLERNGAYDLVFKTIGSSAPTAANPAGIVRVRYCLDSSTAANATLYYQTQPWTSGSTAPTDTACPSSAWPERRALTNWITNRSGGQNRPVFTYNSATLSAIKSIHADLLLDADPARGPKETQLSSGVFLRNQNQPPTALFSATAAGTSIVLNGSQSADPDGDPLKFQFYDKTGATPVAIGSCASVVCTWTPSYTPAGRTYTIGLTVTDSGGIELKAADQQVTV